MNPSRSHSISSERSPSSARSSTIRLGSRFRRAVVTSRGSGPARTARPRAFTLLEILVVVVILGILAAMVIAATSTTTREAAQTGFVQDIKSFTQSAILFKVRTGRYLEDSSSGELPTGFDDYIDERAWLRGPGIGGVWDAELASFGYTSSLGVHFMQPETRQDDTFMAEVDAMFDDGDLADGGFRKIANDRYYAIIAP